MQTNLIFNNFQQFSQLSRKGPLGFFKEKAKISTL
jgi:hypothetical protein